MIPNFTSILFKRVESTNFKTKGVEHGEKQYEKIWGIGAYSID